jgi:hypothetical protein
MTLAHNLRDAPVEGVSPVKGADVRLGPLPVWTRLPATRRFDWVWKPMLRLSHGEAAWIKRF